MAAARESVRWLLRATGPEVVPVVGKNDWIYSSVVEPHPRMPFAQRSFKDFLNGLRPHIGKKENRWVLMKEMPAVVHMLINGSSLLGLAPNAAPQSPSPPPGPTCLWQPPQGEADEEAQLQCAISASPNY